MVLISSNIKEKILSGLNEIINLNDDMWNNLDPDIKFKIIHNLCGKLHSISNTRENFNIETFVETHSHIQIQIPLKNIRPKKLIQLCGINKQFNFGTFEEFKKNTLDTNREFRKNYNKSNGHHCYASISKNQYDILLNEYNNKIYLFMQNNLDKINSNKLYLNLLGENVKKVISDKNTLIEIKNIHCDKNIINIEFNNGINAQLELYLTSEKITQHIPAKYSIKLINIF